MFLKYVALIIVSAIALLQGIYPDKINKKKWYKPTLIGLIVSSMILGLVITKIDDNKTAIDSRLQKKNIDSLKNQNSLLTSKIDSLRKAIKIGMIERSVQETEMSDKVAKLSKNLEPFVKIALTKYPAYDIQSALNRLAQDIENTKKLAQPPKLTPYAKKITRDNKGTILLQQFKPTKNQPLGQITFYVKIIGDRTSKILSFKPDATGGPITWSGSQNINSDGITARISYSMLGAGYPTIELKVSKPTFVEITGNYLPQPYKIIVSK